MFKGMQMTSTFGETGGGSRLHAALRWIGHICLGAHCQLISADVLGGQDIRR